MRTEATVSIWGKTVGTVSQAEGDKTATFTYDKDFINSGLELSPLLMPLSREVFSFPNLPAGTYHGLPGLLADSLPDKFGTVLIDTWLGFQARQPEAFTAIDRLCYTGTQGMGALEFFPETGSYNGYAEHIQLGDLVDLASEILVHRKKASATLSYRLDNQSFTTLLAVGALAGGARAKAVIAWNPLTNELRPPQASGRQGFEPWLLKLDGVHGNRDKEVDDPRGFGAVELAYYWMAVDAGIVMSDCRLFEEGERRHFMTRRFDRSADGEKLHMQSLCALAHFDLNHAGIYSYEQVFQVMRRLKLPMSATEQQFRRMVLNIAARNHDDHAKNIAFLMNEEGRWSLAPAFDITYSYNPTGTWTACHQMTMNGKRDGFSLLDFLACARTAGIEEKSAVDIVREVMEIVSRWDDYAQKAGVFENLRKLIGKNLRRINC